jgi:hypothetical protein
MTRGPIPALSPEALYAKSQVYIGRGYKAKVGGETEQYQLWASLSIELLAKSTLAMIHPALIADPTHFQSLFAACGKPISVDIKTITSKTLYERLSHLLKDFDKRIQRFCEQLALRRNSELHSGESPFSGMKSEVWEGEYWHAVQLLLALQGKALQEWLGAEGSEVPERLLSEANSAIAMAVQVRIDRARQDFNAKFKTAKKRETAIADTGDIRTWDHYDKFEISCEGFARAVCPSCSATGILGGIFWEEEVTDEVEDLYAFVEYVETTYLSEEFVCIVCGLHLTGRRELDAGGLPSEFVETEEREREFEPDYGND